MKKTVLSSLQILAQIEQILYEAIVIVLRDGILGKFISLSVKKK